MHKHYIVGTAGHIDHGKTTLSKALTGKDTDRLKEEKERSISIELGFAPFKLPNGDQVSLIDVPGHEKFIKQMVAGVGGIDLVLLVIAADEGVMPQTKEHIQIIELLGIKNGIIVLTKKDLVDQEYLELVEEEIKDYLKKSTLKDLPIISVSSQTHEGITELKALIEEQLQHIPERQSTGFFRMPIDRVFTLKGIGTVITGTVYSGKADVGQELQIMPQNQTVRIRSLQVHDESMQTAYAGQRVAINITGEDEDINRGDSIVTPKQWEPSTRVDAEVTFLKDIDFSIKENSELKFHIGTAEVVGKIILFDRKEVLPGETVYCQFKLEEPIISSRKERFIIRRPSPSTTIGGGIIIEPNATKHKYRKETVDALKLKSKGTIEDLILDQLLIQKNPILSLNDLSNALILPEGDIIAEIERLLTKQKIISFGVNKPSFYSASSRFEFLEGEIQQHLSKYHHYYPTRSGQSKAEFNNQFFPNLKPKMLQEVYQYWEANRLLKITNEYISLYHFQPSLPETLETKAKLLEKKLMEQGLSPEQWEDLAKEVGLNETDTNEIFNFFLNQKIIYRLTDKLVIHSQSFEELKGIITAFLQKEEQITLQQAKDLLQVSRKYLVPLMELLDQEKITVLRQGHNYRELRKS